MDVPCNESDACSKLARADGTAKIEVLKNPNREFFNGRYKGAYEEVTVNDVFRDPAKHFPSSFMLRGKLKDINVSIVLFLPEKWNSTAPCPIVSQESYHDSNSTLSTITLGFTKNKANGTKVQNEYYFSGKWKASGEMETNEESSGKMTNISISKDKVTCSFQCACYTRSSNIWYHVIGSFAWAAEKE